MTQAGPINCTSCFTKGHEEDAKLHRDEARGLKIRNQKGHDPGWGSPGKGKCISTEGDKPKKRANFCLTYLI